MELRIVSPARSWAARAALIATLSMGCRFADIEVGKNGTGCNPTIGGSDNGILPCDLAGNLLKTRFILINTSHAGNVGAAARAMKVMGFDDLVLVAPRWAIPFQHPVQQYKRSYSHGRPPGGLALTIEAREPIGETQFR